MQTTMRRPLFIALALLFVAALVAPTAQSATRRYDFQDFPAVPGHVTIRVVVLYKNKQRHGPYTPRLATYDSFVPIRCNPSVGATAYARSFSGNGYIKLRKGSFSYSYSSAYDTSAGPPGNISATLTGKVLKRKKGKQLRVNGSVSILDLNYPPPGWNNCTSGGPVPYSATPCRSEGPKPPYIKPGLPDCQGSL